MNRLPKALLWSAGALASLFGVFGVCVFVKIIVVPFAWSLWAEPEPGAPGPAGPEDPSLLGRLECHVLHAPGTRSLVVKALPTASEQRIEITGSIVRMSGPSARGLAACILQESAGSFLGLVDIHQAGSAPEPRLLRRCGDAPGAPPDHLALSPGGRFLAWSKSIQVDSPPQQDVKQFGVQRNLDVLDTVTGSTTISGPKTSGPMSWFPDEVRIAFERHVPRDSIDKGVRVSSELREYCDRRSLEWLPTVCVFDTASRTESFVCVGSRPVVSTSGGVIAYEASPGSVHAVDLVKGEDHELPCPGLCGDVLALVADRYIVYEGRPTLGEPENYDRVPMKAPVPRVTIKVCDSKTGQFATIVRDVSALGPHCSVGP
jgi:hypothetical protein